MTLSRDYRDIAGGLLLAAIGLAAALYARGQYEIGTLSEMGPGMFPTACGWILVGLGLLVAVPALFRSGQMPDIEWRQFFTVVGSVLLFALTIDRFGVIVALAFTIGTSIFAREKGNKLVESIVLYVVITAFAVLLFKTGLGIPLALFKWEL